MNVIGVISGKGGVGKTTTAANVGTALASEFARRVALIDGNPTTPDLALHLGIYSFDKTLKEVLDRKIPIESAMQQHVSGVEVLPSPLTVGGEAQLEGLRDFLEELSGEYEIILVDSPPGLGRDIVPTLDLCDEVLIVTNLDIPAITQALKAIVTATRANVPIRGMVLNMVRGEKYELSPMEVELVFDAPVIAVVPEDPNVRESIAVGSPVVLNKPNSPAAKEFKRLAAALVGVKYVPGILERLITRIKRIFGFGRRVEVPSASTRAKAKAPIGVARKGRPLEERGAKAASGLKELVELTYGDETIAPTPMDAKRKAIKATLSRLDKNYEKGLIRESVYKKLKAKYQEELEP